MFWGSFSGNEKGPCLFWYKSWGNLTSQSYCARALPLINHEIQVKPYLILMQDNAPCHKAQNTVTELDRLGISSIHWPASSPVLNPIESLWNAMKDYIAMKCREDISESRHGRRRQFPLSRLIEMTREAWESIKPEELSRLIESMPRRCEAVINAGGDHISYQCSV